MIIGLAGYGRSGKDTVAEILVRERGFTRVAFADKLREALYALNPLVPHDGHNVRLRELVDNAGWDRAKAKPEVRRLLQHLGTDVARNLWGQDFWVERLMADYEGQDWVVSDVRFPSEAKSIWRRNGKVFRVVRPGYGPVNDHPSETALDDVFLHRLVNDGTIEELEANVLAMDL